MRLCFLQRWGAEDSCRAGLPSHPRRFPLKYQTWLASAESINPKRDGIPPFKKRKVGRPALFYFDGSDKSTFEHLTFTDPTSASRNSAVSTKERQNRERAGPQCEITSAPRLATSLRWRPIALPVSTTIEGTRCHIHFSIVGTTASFGATVSANLFATSSQAPANTACDTDPASIDEMAR